MLYIYNIVSKFFKIVSHGVHILWVVFYAISYKFAIFHLGLIDDYIKFLLTIEIIYVIIMLITNLKWHIFIAYLHYILFHVFSMIKYNGFIS